MATINSKEIVDSIIAGSGWALDLDPNMEDPMVVMIVEFTTPGGATAYGLIYAGEDPDKYYSSPYVLNPHAIWSVWDEEDLTPV